MQAYCILTNFVTKQTVFTKLERLGYIPQDAHGAGNSG